MNKVCVIAGAGPSLAETNIDLIPDTAMFIACNHYYKITKKYTRQPDAIVITDSHRITEVGDNYSDYKGDLYIGNQDYINPPVDKIKSIIKREFFPIPQLPKRRLRNFGLINDFKIPQILHD